MTSYCVNRLTVIGPARSLNAFGQDDRWAHDAGVKYFDVLEYAPRRHAWQFEVESPPVAWLRRESRRWPSLVFLLDYDCEQQRCKGLLKARRGRVCHHRVRY